MRKIEVQHNRKTYEFLLKSEKRINFLFGGAGSGKSHALAQFFLLEKLYKEHNIRILITRKTRPALKKSCWLLVNDLLVKYDLPGYVINKTDLIITVGDNQMYFTSLDDVEKIKSFEKMNYVWCEEATENTKDDFIQLGLRCRGENPNGTNKLYFSFNPIDEQSFLKEKVENPDKNTAVNHSTYLDNRFAEQDYIDVLTGLEKEDITYYKIYKQGIWASPENIIYKNWDIVEKFPEVCDDIGYGLDFGFNNPTALVKIGFSDNNVYEEEMIYQSKLTNSQLIEEMKILIPKELRDKVIRADSAEPQRIEEISQAAFNIFPCTKGKDSVKIGIDRVKRVLTHITKNSTNIIMEKKGYKWKEDKNGNVLDEPVKFKDHAMDAERYYLGEVPAVEAGIWELGQYQ